MQRHLEKLLMQLVGVCSSWIGKYILKCANKHKIAVSSKIMIIALSEFPDNSVRQNIRIVDIIISENFHQTKDFEDDSDVDEAQLSILRERVKSDEWIRNTISNYFLVRAYFWVNPIKTDALKERSNSEIERARQYIDGACEISAREFEKIRKLIKTDARKLTYEARKIFSKRVKLERDDAIGTFHVKGSHVASFVATGSILLLAGGFIHNKIFFLNFDISLGTFFELHDYVAASSDILFGLIVATIIVGIVYILGMLEGLDQHIRVSATGIERPWYRRYLFLILVFVPTLYWVAMTTYTSGRLEYDPHLQLLLVIIVFYIIQELPLWKYIENALVVSTISLFVALFLIQLWISAMSSAQSIKDGTYVSPYVIEFGEKYKKFSENTLIASNTNYLFMWDEKTRKINVIPKSSVIYFSTNEL